MNVLPQKTIGIDFDNTLLTYDQLFHHLALESGWITASFPKSKTAVRDRVRQLPDGETRWQDLQAAAYGPLIYRAEPSPGVFPFLKRCRSEGARVHVVSHKTEFAARDQGGCHLHNAALGWLEQNRFFEPSGGSLSRENIHFLPTRLEKIQRIARLECHYFIDDLKETFLEPGFPARVVPILYSARAGTGLGPEVRLAGSFQDVESIIFG